MVSYYSTFVPKTYVFLRYSTSKICWPWNPGKSSLKVIGTDTYRSAAWLPVNVP